jgi:hypothetical protein
MNIFSFELIDTPSTQASSVFNANDPIYVFKNPSHLTYENMADLQIDNDQSFISQLQQNPWIHLDLGLERFIDSVTVTMNPQNLTDLYIYIGYEIPKVSKENVLPLEINTLCGHIELDSVPGMENDLIDLKIDCGMEIHGTQITIQLVSFIPVQLNIFEVIYDPTPGKFKIFLLKVM